MAGVVLVLVGCDAPKTTKTAAETSDAPKTASAKEDPASMTPERARELFDTGDYEAAEKAYTELLEAKPGDAQLQDMLRVVRQNIAARVGKWRVSQQGFVRRAALNPTSTVIARRMKTTDPLVVECDDGVIEVRLVVTPHLAEVATTTLTVELPAGAEPEEVEARVEASRGSYVLTPSRDWVRRLIAHPKDRMNMQIPTRDGVDEVTYDLDGADQALSPLLACIGAKSDDADMAGDSEGKAPTK